MDINSRKIIFKVQIVVFFVSAIMCFSAYRVLAQKIVPVTKSNYKYVLTIPEGWDTIPKEILNQKLQQHQIDVALYPVQQADYFDGNYVLIGFSPSMRSLNEFQFSKIAEEITTVIKNEMSVTTDTLQTVYKSTELKVANDNYHIYTNFTIVKDSITIDGLQDMLLTKFGYISMLSYKKPEGIYALQAVANLLSGSIRVEETFKYTEPVVTQRFTLKQIAFTLCIGLLVYVIIMFVFKDKKDKK